MKRQMRTDLQGKTILPCALSLTYGLNVFSRGQKRPPRLGCFGTYSSPVESLDEVRVRVTHFHAKQPWFFEMFEVVAGEAMPQRIARPIGDPGAFPVCLQFDPQIDGAELSGLGTVRRKPRSQSWSDRDVTACGGFGLTSSYFHQTSLKIDVLPFQALQFSTAQPAPAAERPVGERLRPGALQELPELFRTQDSGFRALPFSFLDLSKRIGCAPPATPSKFKQNGEAQPEGVPGQRSDAQITEPCLDLIKTEFGDFARPKL